MEILGLENVSLVDWEEKVCATVFTGGCNFLCPFCHNSGLVRKEIDAISEAEVLEYLRSRTGLLDGVVVSGGEPTLQPDLELFLKKVKDMGYLIKLDTNGARPEVLKTILDNGLIDYVAMYIKNNFDDYSKITGLKKAPIEKIKESLKILEESKVNYELRTTLVSEFHSKANIEKLAEDLSGQKILYLQRFIDSGSLIDTVNTLHEVPSSAAEEYKSILENGIKRVVLRGY